MAAFGRDTESSEQVWSAEHGYPGDPHYRDFYRDIGFDLPLDYIGPYIHPDGHRMYTGFKYHAITHDKLHDKWVYDPDIARGKAGLHASHFRGNRRSRSSGWRRSMDRPPIIVSPYDAELYGHWWFEGPLFLDDLFRQLALRPVRHRADHARATTSSGHPTNQVATPCASSWGTKGYNEQWLNETNAWIYRHVHVAGERMVELAHDVTRDAERARPTRAQPGRARAAAGAVERLGVHHVDRDHRSLRRPGASTSTSSSSTSSTTICRGGKVNEPWLTDAGGPGQHLPGRRLPAVRDLEVPSAPA